MFRLRGHDTAERNELPVLRGTDKMTYTPLDYWDARARTGIGMAECGSLHASMLGMMREYVGEFDTFLEVGTGDGRIYEYITDRIPEWSHRYSGCDISAEYAALCEIRTGLLPKVWDGVTLPYDDGSFDWVISFSVLLHVPPADIERHVSELLRVSRQVVFVSTYTGPGDGLAAHCFKHDYDALFAGAQVLEYRDFPDERNSQWLLMV